MKAVTYLADKRARKTGRKKRPRKEQQSALDVEHELMRFGLKRDDAVRARRKLDALATEMADKPEAERMRAVNALFRELVRKAEVNEPS